MNTGTAPYYVRLLVSGTPAKLEELGLADAAQAMQALAAERDCQ